MTKKVFPYAYIFWISISIAFFIVGCSTDKDAWVNRSYHNTTAKYNGYFNAGEIIKEAMDGHSETRIEDYSKIIPVFEYANEIESKSLYPAMDTAAKKCESVISRHSMPSEKKGQYRKTEWCKWIDDNWLLIGKSQFYKRNFNDALKKFKYVEKQYSNRTIMYHATLWKAKTLIELEQYNDAEELLKELIEGEEAFNAEIERLAEEKKKEKEKKKKRKSSGRKKTTSKKKSSKKEEDSPPEYPKHFDRHIAPVYADLLIRKEEYPKAIEKLEEAIELEKNRTFKTRLIFILAQIHHKLGNQEASNLYAKVVKLNPEYDMAFQAKINRALAFSGGNKRGIKAELLKMLKDDKNVDYLDQIYFALADIELRDDNKKQGIEYLELSIANSNSNDEQKSKSFLRLGKLYYGEKNYIKAQQYYDSTMAVLPTTHPEFQNIESRNVSLSELVDNLNTIEKQDSIASLCALSEKELLSKIEDLIAEKRDEDERIKSEQENFIGTNPFNTPANSLPNKGGVFWAWDNGLRGSGFNDFKQSWGSRTLEDDWRRKDKSSSEIGENGIDSEEEKEEYTTEFYLKDLPCKNEKEMDIITADIVDALYNAGTIYKMKLDDSEAAKEPFSNLVQNYLPKPKAIAALYQLYLLSSGAEKDRYKNQILNDYPNSEYAQLIKNPNYKQNEQLTKEKDAQLYADTYNQFLANNHSAVINTCDDVITNNNSNIFLCKFYYLKSMSIGKKNGGVDTNGELEKSLEDVVNHCLGTDVHQPAQNALNRLKNVETLNSPSEKYKYDPTLNHYFVLVMPNGEGNSNNIKSTISNFNSASFTSLGLKTSNSFLDQNTQLILVKSFKKATDAEDYFLAFKVNKSNVNKIRDKYAYFLISSKNYGVLYADKNIDDYLNFFEKYYNK